MHERSARLLDLISAGHDYADDARRLEWIIESATPILVESLLDVGCGTGNHLAALRPRFAVEGLDLDPAVLTIARDRLPDVPLHRADMTRFDLGRQIDTVLCLGGTIGYAATIETLRRVLVNLARHLNPGGVAVVAPWVFREDWVDGSVDAELVDLPEVKVALIRVFGRAGGVSTLDAHYLVFEGGTVESFVERHELGLFSHEEYLTAFVAAGLDVSYLPDGLGGSGLFVGVKPAPARGFP